MATSVFSSLFNMLDSSNINEIASRLAEPGQAVARGLEGSTASLISCLAGRASDPASMNHIFRLAAEAPSDLNVSNLAGAVTGSGGASSTTTSLLDSGKKILYLAFGSDQSSILSAIGKSAGLRASSVTSILSMAAPLLMVGLGRLVRSEHLSQEQLAGLLVDESAGIKGLLPAGLQGQFDRPAPATATARPLEIGTVPESRRSSQGWLWVIPVLFLIPVLMWLFNRAHIRQVTRVMPAAPERARLPATGLGNFVVRNLPGNIQLKVPQLGVESRLLEFIQDPSKNADQVVWFDFDRLLFDTDSAELQPASRDQLGNIAAILKAYPAVHMKIGGYTDNTGDPQHNLKLSQDRADAVVRELVNLGVQPERLESQGYGDQYPVADNSTEEGRAKNRRISMRVTQK